MKSKNNSISIRFNVDSNIYPLEAILNTSYAYIDRLYIFLDSDKKGRLMVSMKVKKRASMRQLELLKEEFMNELLYNVLRYKISMDNKKIREYIVGRALYSAQPDSYPIAGELSGEKSDYKEDPLGIAIPWEEKYGKKKKSARSKV